MWAKPVVESDAFGDALDVGANELAHVRDLVDEGDARHQKRVRGKLDHLGRVDVGANDRGIDSRMQRLDCVSIGLVARANDDAVGLHEIADGSALGGELGIRDIADVREPTPVEGRPHLLACTHGHGRLHDDRRARVGGQFVDDRPNAG